MKKSLSTLLFQQSSLTIAVYIAIFIQYKFFVYFVGMNDLSDTYYLAIAIPVMFSAALSAGFDAVVVPYLKRFDVSKYKAIFISILIVIPIITGFGLVGGVVYTNFTVGSHLLNSRLLPGLLFSLGAAVYFIAAVFRSMLASRERFHEYLWGQLFSALFFSFLIALSPPQNLTGLATYYFIAALPQALVPLRGIQLTFVPKKYEVGSEKVINLLKLVTPVGVGNLILLTSPLIDRYFSHGLGVGTVSVFFFSERIVFMMLGAIVASFSVIIFPRLANLARNNDKVQDKKFLEFFKKSLAFTVWISIPSSLSLWLFGPSIVKYVFLGGAFTRSDVNLVSQTLALFSFWVPVIGITFIFTRGLQSIGLTRHVALVASIMPLINLVGKILLVGRFGMVGIVSSYGFMYLIAMVLQFFVLLKYGALVPTWSWFYSLLRIAPGTALLFIVWNYSASILSGLDSSLVLRTTLINAGLFCFLFLVGFIAFVSLSAVLGNRVSKEINNKIGIFFSNNMGWLQVKKEVKL